MIYVILSIIALVVYGLIMVPRKIHSVQNLYKVLCKEKFMTRENLELALSKCLTTRPNGKFYCSSGSHRNSIVRIAKSNGKFYCKCDACGMRYSNVVDIYEQFGELKFKDAVVQASRDLGLIKPRTRVRN